MSISPYDKMKKALQEVKREIIGTRFLKQEIMYSYQYNDIVIGFSRCKYG
jgi:hypothetical protein